MHMNRLSGFLAIQPGEGRTTALLTCLMFLLSAGLYVGAPGIESLFLIRFGFEFLPYMFTILGGVIAAVTILISTLTRRIPNHILYRILPLILAAAVSTGRFLIRFDFSWLYPILFLCIYIFWTIQNLFAWGTAGMVYDTRQAKRLFPLLGAGGILGSAAGGLVTRPLVSLVGAANLILVWAGTLVVGSLVANLLIRRARPTPNHRPPAARRSRRRAGDGGAFSGVSQGYRSVVGSRFMRRFALAAVAFGFMYFLLQFPFSREATLQFPNADRLAGFLGLFQGSAMAAGFLLSLLAANRLFARIGFLPSIWVLSLIYLLGFSAVSLLPVFPALIAFRFFQLSWYLGIATSAYQAVFNIVPPKNREQTRMFVTGVARPLGISTAGAVLVVLRLFLPLDTVFYVGAGVAAAAAAIVYLAAKKYGQALSEALRSGRPQVFFQEERPFGGFQRDERAVSVALAGISDRDPRLRRVSAEVLGSLHLPEATDSLVSALEDPDDGVRSAILRALGNTGACSALLEISTRLRDSSAEVRLQAIRELFRLAPYPSGLKTHLQPLLRDAEPAVRANAAAVLLNLGDSGEPKRVLQELLGSTAAERRISALQACGQWKSAAAYELIKSSVHDGNPNVRCQALRSMAAVDPRASAGELIRSLNDDSRFVVQTASSLIHLAGRSTLPSLLEALESPVLEKGALRALALFPREQLQTQRSGLAAFAARKAERTQRYRDMLRKLRSVASDGALPLAGALTDGLFRNAVSALTAAALLSDPESSPAAIEDLRSRDADQKANALEMLDGLEEKTIVREVLPLFERGIEADVRSAPFAEEDCTAFWLTALKEPDPWVRACALYSLPHPTKERFRTVVERLTADADPLVRDTAAGILKRGEEMKTLPTLSTLEKILFLKKVPLFAEFDPPQLKQVSAICREQWFADGETMALQGEIGEEMYIIAAGRVRILDERSVELASRAEGEVVGEMSVISRVPRMATMRASGEVRVLSINQGEFEQILRECPEASLAVMRVLCDRLRESRMSRPG
jgi:HEAT repeat protein